jgi:hypothetical protein
MEKASNAGSSSSNEKLIRSSENLRQRKVSGELDVIDSSSLKNFANTNAYLDIGENNLYKSLGTNFNATPILIDEKSSSHPTPEINKHETIFPFDITKKKLNFIEESHPILVSENPERRLSPPPKINEGSIINFGSRPNQFPSESLIIDNQAIGGNSPLISPDKGKNDNFKRVDSQQVKIITGEVLD